MTITWVFQIPGGRVVRVSLYYKLFWPGRKCERLQVANVVTRGLSVLSITSVVKRPWGCCIGGWFSVGTCSLQAMQTLVVFWNPEEDTAREVMDQLSRLAVLDWSQPVYFIAIPTALLDSVSSSVSIYSPWHQMAYL